MVKYTDSQKLACDISRNIAVTAGAGSGKTSILVERYLWCLQNNDYQVRRIVAITFTEKAAGEMLGRIRDRVLTRISSEIGDSQQWEDILEQLPLANISTIHGFCQRLLREFPIEASVDPNFEVFDEAARHILLTHLCDELIRQRAESDDQHIRLLAQLWTSSTLRNVLIQLLEFRDKSLPWAEQIVEQRFPDYLNHLYRLVEQLQQQGIRYLASHPHWQGNIQQITTLIPTGDTSKLTSRCRNIIDFDAEFRQQHDLAQQLTTLAMLKKDCRMITPNKAWKEDNRHLRLKAVFAHLKTLYDRHLPQYDIHADLESNSFLIQQALAHLLLAAYDLYSREKVARQMLDFDDLQERALLLLEHPAVYPLLSRRYDYIMVDEFQDTNQLQWEIIRRLGDTGQGLPKDKFCVVGDEKQSIYMFRGAEVSVFGDVCQELQQANRDHQLLTAPLKMPEFGDPPKVHEVQKSGELIMAENFRSSKPLIFFLNYLFSRLFLHSFDAIRPYEVTHQQLIARRQTPQDAQQTGTESIPLHPVEFLLAEQTFASNNDSPALEEPELVALRIWELLDTSQPSGSQESESPPLRFQDIAILLRTRTRLKAFEEALRQHHIPFIVAGGIGFYEQQEIYDLANLLRFLADTQEEIPLAGILRSPLLSFSDDQLLYAVAGIRSETEWTLWGKLRHHAQSPDLIPQELDPPKFVHAYNLLCRWQSLSERIPMTHLIRQVLEDTGLYGILAGNHDEIQRINNIEKLLDIARKFENEGFQTLSDFVLYLDQLIAIGEREGEAQIHTEGMNVVQLMTIHAAKGLEFPVVFVPELERPFNYGSSEPVYIDALPSVYQHDGMPTIIAGLKGLDPEQNYAADNTIQRNYLKRLNEEKTDAEMKRLLYVACTRAEDHLILSGTLTERVSQNSWFSWLKDILPLEEAFSQQHPIMLNSEADSDEEILTLEIPIRTASNYQESQLFKRALEQKTKESQETLNLNILEKQYTMGSTSEVASILSPNGEIISAAELLHTNLRPVKGHENEIFRISPSTLHLLFQCPRKYYYQEILQFNKPLLQELFPVPEMTKEQPSFGAKRGTIIHSLFEKQIFDDLYNEQERQTRITRTLCDFDIPSYEKSRMGLDAAINKARIHYESSGLKDLLASSAEVHREYPFQLKLGQAAISGVLDVLFLDAVTNTWTILDYKSNEVEIEEIEGEISKHGYDIQMQMYALAVSRLLQVSEVRCILFFTFAGSRYETIDLSQDALHKLEKTLSSALENISKGNIPTTPNPQECASCHYRRSGICQI